MKPEIINCKRCGMEIKIKGELRCPRCFEPLYQLQTCNGCNKCHKRNLKCKA